MVDVGQGIYDSEVPLSQQYLSLLKWLWKMNMKVSVILYWSSLSLLEKMVRQSDLYFLSILWYCSSAKLRDMSKLALSKNLDSALKDPNWQLRFRSINTLSMLVSFCSWNVFHGLLIMTFFLDSQLISRIQWSQQFHNSSKWQWSTRMKMSSPLGRSYWKAFQPVCWIDSCVSWSKHLVFLRGFCRHHPFGCTFKHRIDYSRRAQYSRSDW